MMVLWHSDSTVRHKMKLLYVEPD